MNCNAQIIEKELFFLKKHLPFTVMFNKCNVETLYKEYLNFTSNLDLESNKHDFVYEFNNITFYAETHINEGLIYIVESHIKFKSSNVLITFTFDIHYDYTNYLKDVELKTIDYAYIDDDNKTTFNVEVLKHDIVFISHIQSLIDNSNHVKLSMDSLSEFLEHSGYVLICANTRSNDLNGIVANGSNFVKFLNPN